MRTLVRVPSIFKNRDTWIDLSAVEAIQVRGSGYSVYLSSGVVVYVSDLDPDVGQDLLDLFNVQELTNVEREADRLARIARREVANDLGAILRWDCPEKPEKSRR